VAYSHIGIIERQLFSSVPRHKVPAAFVAATAGRHRSTVYRELRRNADPPGRDLPERSAAAAAAAPSHYHSWHAQARARARRTAAAGPGKLSPGTPLSDYVVAKLRLRWSPQQIAARLVVDFPDDPAMRCSHQTIYALVTRDKRLGDASRSGGRLFKLLRRGGKRYRRKHTKAGRSHIPNRVGIEARPAEVRARTHVGHLEADTVHGRRTNACLTTLVERKTRFTMIRRCPNRRAEVVARAAGAALLQHLPQPCRRTITFDNGSEFARHAELTRLTGVAAYFANPYSAWERGANENANGLIRQFFPKGTNFSRVSDAEVANVERLLNDRPRKCLDWRTPREMLEREIAVALGG
jgi:IS30 family transposase